MGTSACVIPRVIPCTRAPWWNFHYLIFTVRKRSLGQGNIFRGVCQEFYSQGGRAWKGRAWKGCAWGDVCGGGLHGRGACIVGACLAGGRAWRGGGHAWQIPRDTVNERAVHILLECILVIIVMYWYRYRANEIFPQPIFLPMAPTGDFMFWSSEQDNVQTLR